MYAHSLDGCRARPLGDYLKALGVHRLVAEQADPDARSAWVDGQLRLHSVLDEAALIAFFDQRYRPTPVISPWNGSSGFYPGEKQAGIGPLSQSSDQRHVPYRDAIAVARRVLVRLGADEEGGVAKEALLEHLRAELPDEALAWMDAAILLTADEPRYPPLLGTGGNDGHFEFSNNFMQRIVELAAMATPERVRLLRLALYGTPTPGLRGAAVGQFLPGQAGGFNTGLGFDGKSRVNPWDFVFLIEGSLAFAAAAVRKLETAGAAELAFPFMVRAAAAGYPSAAGADEASTRDELWLPLWGEPAAWPALRQLFSEGRALVAGDGRARPAVSALDFARAVGSLGTDRGVDAFERYGFHERNGLSTLAVPLGTWKVRRNAGIAGLEVLDAWAEAFGRATRKERAPASLVRLRRALDEATLRLCAADSAATRLDLLACLGRIELQLGRSRRWATEAHVGPVPWLGAGWLASEGLAWGPEEALALALAAGGLRKRMSPVDDRRGLRWAETEGPGRVWSGRALQTDLSALVLRHDVEGGDSDQARGGPGAPGGPLASLDDIAAFLAGAVDDDRIAALALGFALIQPAALASRAPSRGRRGRDPVLPPLYALAALAWARPIDGQAVKRVPGLVRRLLSGDARGASLLALRRLQADGHPALGFHRRRLTSPEHGLAASPALARRVGSALAFALHDDVRRQLAELALVPDEARRRAQSSPSTPETSESA